MISKEQKLQYGQILRMQMRQRQERKKLEELQKRGAPKIQQAIEQPVYYQPVYQPQPTYVSHPQPTYLPQPMMPPSPDLHRKQNVQTNLIDKKEMLQKKLEMGHYDPFGRGGAGAPLRDYKGDIITHRKPVISNGQSAYHGVEYPPQPISQQYAQQPYIPPQPIQQPISHSTPNIYPQNVPPPIMAPSQIQQRMPSQPIGQSYVTIEQAKQAFNQGGRNLLQLENMGLDEISQKQRQKLEMQRVLKEQMEEAQRRKQQEKQRIRREEEIEEQQNRMYLEQQKRKVEQEEKKRKMKEENARLANERQKQALEQPKKKKLIDMPPIQHTKPVEPPAELHRQSHRQPQRQTIPHQNFVVQKQQKQTQQEEDDMLEQQFQQGFNTDVSREFLRREKQKNPERQKQDKHLQEIKSQIERMRQEFDNRGQRYEIEIERMKMEAERAKQDKQKSDFEVNQLKEQLRRKMDEENQKLQMALLKNDPNNYQSRKHQEPERKVTPLRANDSQPLVQKKYKVEPIVNNSSTFQQGLQSLVAQTKKIPVLIKNNDKLSMSRIDDFAVDSRFFHKKSSNNVVQNRSDVIYEAEEDQNNNAVPKEFNMKYQKVSQVTDPYKNQFQDSLTDFVKKQAPVHQPSSKDIGKWSKNMTSVDSEIGRQIEKLLKDQRRVPSRGGVVEQRPTSKLSEVGKNSLAADKYGYAVQGLTLKSDEPGTIQGYGTRNSFDLDRINHHNDRRLDKLRAMGLDTVQGDDELDKLNVMLNKYAN